MWRKLAFFAFLLLPCVCMADDESVSIDPETNLSVVEEKIKINEDEFDSLVNQVKKRYPDFNWDEFNILDSDTKRIVLENYVARLAFEQIQENYIQDIYARSKDGVVMNKYAHSTEYFNKSDELYRNSYLDKEIFAKKLGAKNKICNTVIFEKKDVKLLDELIKQETEKTLAKTYCFKDCFVLTQSDDCKTVTYSEDCDMIDVSCFNVEPIPETHERFYLLIENYSKNKKIQYDYDDIVTNRHIISDAFMQCDCGDGLLSVKTLSSCNCSISFYDEIIDFNKFRDWENRDRLDIANGKLEDIDENGKQRHDDWPGDHGIPGGYVKGRTLYMTNALFK